MRRIFTLILIISCVFGAHAQNNADVPKDYNVNIKIPSSWIDKLRNFNYTNNDSTLLHQFESFLAPDTLVNPHAQHVDPSYGRVLDPMFVNLDSGTGNELITLLGWDVTSPYLCVFKEKQGSWYLIYMEEIDTFYGSPTLAVANCFSKNKPFYLRRVYDHGSGIYIDGFSFYKLINGKVYRCLDLVNEAHIYGWGLYMNQAITMSFEFSGDSSDELLVNYNYNFFPGAIKKGNCSWCINDNVPLIKGDASAYYKWDDKQLVYKLDIPSYQNDVDDLTAAKISCFGAFGNDTLFVSAFNGQIQEVLKTGTKEQKKILNRYLKLVKKNGKAVTEEMQVTNEVNGTTFYRPKE